MLPNGAVDTHTFPGVASGYELLLAPSLNCIEQNAANFAKPPGRTSNSGGVLIQEFQSFRREINI